MVKIQPMTRSLVSTHSHPKVAATSLTVAVYQQMFQHTATRRWLQNTLKNQPSRMCFNTQPPEGGCPCLRKQNRENTSFNTQPPEGGCVVAGRPGTGKTVSTHSHPKVAAKNTQFGQRLTICFNTQPPEGGCAFGCTSRGQAHSFNTQPPEGGCLRAHRNLVTPICFNTQPPEGGCPEAPTPVQLIEVSTHSHPKVAAGGINGYKRNT